MVSRLSCQLFLLYFFLVVERNHTQQLNNNNIIILILRGICHVSGWTVLEAAQSKCLGLVNQSVT